MPLISPVYCTIAELQRYLSATAVTDFADHNADGIADDDVVEDCINQATELLGLYLRHQHTQAQLATSSIVTRWCVTIAARYLCLRRGNTIPDTVERDFGEALELVQEIRKSFEGLPGIPLRADLRPTFSNATVDRRFWRSTIRVTGANSSDAPSALTQDKTADFYPVVE